MEQKEQDDRVSNARNEYISTYKRDFTGEFGRASGSRRPRSSSVYPKCGQMEIPTYRNDFQAKPTPQKTELIRTESSSRNNPHPLKPFIVWRLNGLDALKQWRKLPVDRHGINSALHNQIKSTYQVDFTGTQNG